jgi:DNA-binding beta-propeller fold protein YncE
VQKFDSKGKFLAKFGSSGSGDGKFTAQLADIAVDAQGNVYVTDRENGIQKFDSNGQFAARFDTCGDRLFYSATGVALDTHGNVYVSDVQNHRICKFDSEGHFVNFWDSFDGIARPLSDVGGVAVDQQGNIYVSELFDGRVRKFR